MATAVVSGRVDERIKQEVDRILQREGKTPGDVIKDVWTTIYQTGRLPITQEQEDEFKRKRQGFAELMEFVHTAPASPSWATSLTDKEMNDMIAKDQMERWGYV